MNQITPPLLSNPLVGAEEFSFLRDELLPEIFAATAARQPTALAVQFGATRLTYGELELRANRVAQALRARGIGHGDFVGLWMARSLDLHVALLGILKAGAAYLPFDADLPAERVADCLGDCAAKAIVQDAFSLAKSSRLPVPQLAMAELAAHLDASPIDLREAGLRADDAAYAIYTSGSTGKPKGIVITHQNICHYLRAANSLYGLTAGDVVFQGASVAFDLSLEEIFVPYLVGASLWVASRQVLQNTDRLADLLEEAGITVLDTVPTLLAMLPRDVASLRVIILGGEACPPALAARWCRPGRRLFNSYGPTEATVVATIAEVRPDAPVTIGQPIPNYSAYVVDDQLRLLPEGVEGELLIGGPGVARGYLHRPELTADKFIANPFRQGGLDPVLYRSGDAVSIGADGTLLFHGRIDDQVKVRGFRVELGEIEARLTGCAGVSQAAVVLRDDGGSDRLVAFLLPQTSANLDKVAIDKAALRTTLRSQLPIYMVPDHFEVVADLPRLTSGKVDRKALKLLPLSAFDAVEQEEPQTPTEAALLAAARRVFAGQAIPLEADFFMDLGGHSLLAARFVSAVRETPVLAGLTLQNVYDLRSLRGMAAHLDEQGGCDVQDLSFQPPPLLRRLLCGLAQAAALPVILALATAPWLGVFVAYELFSGEEHNFLRETLALLVTYAIINFGTALVAILGKWLVIGRTRPGRYPLWGVYYYRWWLSQRFVSMTHLKWFQGSPIMSLFLRAIGARVGHDTMVGDIEAGALDLVSFGDGCAVGGKVQFANAVVAGNELIIGRITVGAEAYVGTSCVLGYGTELAEGTELADLTALPPETRTAAWDIWEGSPGRRTGQVDHAALPSPAVASPRRRAVMGVLYLVMLVLLPPVSLVPIIPAFYLFDNLSDSINGLLPGVSYLWFLPILAWPTAMALIAITVVLIALIRWIMLPRVKAGLYSVHSGFYLRKWVVSLATELTLETLSSLYATVYMRAWYRLMGAKIGKDAEISTNLAGRYDLVEIGAKCFIADEVVLGDESIRRGWMDLQPVRTGDRVFVGNDAVVPAGSDIPEGTLIGIKSRPPANELMRDGGDQTWFGSPPIKLPVRQRFDDVATNWTYEPSRRRRLGRALFEACTVSMPSMLFITFGTLAVEVLSQSILDRDFATVIPLFMVASVAISLALVAVAIGVKWLMMGVYRPTARPMWSWWALRTESVAVMYWGMAGKVLLDHLRGTPMLPWVLRLFGCKFGKGVFMDTTDITEFDCVKVGDFTVINTVSALQTHLYEDRVMKVGRVTVGKGVTIGTNATVLYDTRVGDFARIGSLSIIMKGEEIPPHSQWHGAPAETVGRPSVAVPLAVAAE